MRLKLSTRRPQVAEESRSLSEVVTAYRSRELLVSSKNVTLLKEAQSSSHTTGGGGSGEKDATLGSETLEAVRLLSVAFSAETLEMLDEDSGRGYGKSNAACSREG